jgi:hypothetical protein
MVSQGSPTPDSLQTRQSRVTHEARTWSVKTPVGNSCWQAVMHEPTSLQLFSQLRRFSQAGRLLQLWSWVQQLIDSH